VPVRRLLVALILLTLLSLVVYRQRTIDRWERTLGIGANAGGTARH
jgi:hypothetical protein